MRKRILYSLVMLFAGYALQAQSYDTYDTLKLISEKLTVSCNKDVYLAGEELAFVVHSYDAVYNLRLSLSSVAYVELVSQGGLTVNTAKLYLEDGVGKGTMLLPKKMQTDYYYLKVYTGYMRNFGPEVFAYSRFGVINTFKHATSDDFDIDSALSLDIVKEYDKLLAGMPNTIACASKYLNKDDFKACRISDTTGNIFAEEKKFSDFIFLTFTPDTGTVYQIEYCTADSVYTFVQGRAEPVKEYFTPAKEDKGMVLNLHAEGKEQYSYDLYKNNIRLKSIPYTGLPLRVLYDELPEGIYCIALKKNGKTVYNKFFWGEYADVSTPKIEISDRIVNRDTFSVTVTEPASSNICFVNRNSGERLNTADPLRVNDMSQYLDSVPYSLLERACTDEKAREFVLLQCRLNEHETEMTYTLEPEGDQVKGVLRTAADSKPAAGVDMLVSIPDSSQYFLDVVETDENGEFTIILTENFETPFILFSTADTSNDYSLSLEKEFDKRVKHFAAEPFIPDKEMAEYLKDEMLTLQVKDAYSSNFSTKVTKKYKSFYGRPDNLVVFDEFINLPIFQEYIKELMPGVYVIKKKKKKYIRISDYDGQGFTGEHPLMLVNGVHVRDYDVILNLPPKEVTYVKIVNRIVYFKNLRFDGILEVYTRDVMPVDKLNKKNCFVKNYGIPYNDATIDLNDIPSNIPVYSNSLYADENTEGAFNVYMNDEKGEFSVKCISVSKDMKRSVAEKTFEVK